MVRSKIVVSNAIGMGGVVPAELGSSSQEGRYGQC
jgi:hypothetical protein